MHKRFLGIFASVAVIVAACGGATTSATPGASTAPVTSSAPVTSTAPGDSGAPSAAAGDLDPNQVLKLYLSAEDPKSLDPAIAETSTDIAILRSLTRGLMSFDKDLNVVPELAAAMPEVSADGITYTFKLRDWKYSNGDPIVADDLVYSWKRLIDPRLAATYQSFLAVVKGGSDLLDLTGKKPAATDAEVEAALAKFGVAAPDPKTFVVTLERPTSYFLEIPTLWGTSPYQKKWVDTKNFATEAANFVSSGPFQMKSWTHQSEIVLEPNPNWAGAIKPTLKEVDFHIGGAPAAAQIAFEAGETDMQKAPPNEVPRIKADPTLGPLVKTVPVLTFDYWGFDTSKGPTANKHFRRALSMAIDKETLLATAYGGQGLVAGSPIPPGMPGHQADIGLKYDLTAAKAELAMALTELKVSDVSQLPVLSFGFNTQAGHDVPAAFMQEQWSKNLGVKSELKGVTFAQFADERPKLVYSIARNAWGADYPHPDNFLRALYQSKSGNNDEGYKSPEFDKLVADAAAEPDMTKSLALYAKAQELLVEDAPAVFTRWRITNYEIRPYVTGYVGTGQDSENIGDLFLETIKILKH